MKQVKCWLTKSSIRLWVLQLIALYWTANNIALSYNNLEWDGEAALCSTVQWGIVTFLVYTQFGTVLCSMLAHTAQLVSILQHQAVYTPHRVASASSCDHCLVKEALGSLTVAPCCPADPWPNFAGLEVEPQKSSSSNNWVAQPSYR